MPSGVTRAVRWQGISQKRKKSNDDFEISILHVILGVPVSWVDQMKADVPLHMLEEYLGSIPFLAWSAIPLAWRPQPGLKERVLTSVAAVRSAMMLVNSSALKEADKPIGLLCALSFNDMMLVEEWAEHDLVAAFKMHVAGYDHAVILPAVSGGADMSIIDSMLGGYRG